MSSIVDIGEYTYDTNREIGRGAFGIVYDCKSKANPELKLCIKVIVSQIDDPKIKREMDLMKHLITASSGNKNVVKVEYVDMQTEKILIILEKCDGDLQQLMDRKKKNGDTFNANEALDIIKQVINGYKILFCNNIIHRDMKPANILYRGGVYKIADFGLARIMDENTKDVTKVGTPKYAAPQLFHEPTFTNLADVFSLGIMFYEMIFGCIPYNAKSQSDVRRALRNIKTNPIKVDLSNPKPGLNLDIAELIEQMLMYSEAERISWERLFQHPLMKEDNNQNINKSIFIVTESNEDDDDDDKEVVTDQPIQQSPVSEEQQVVQQPTGSVYQTPQDQIQQNQFTPQPVQLPQQNIPVPFPQPIQPPQQMFIQQQQPASVVQPAAFTFHPQVPQVQFNQPNLPQRVQTIATQQFQAQGAPKLNFIPPQQVQSVFVQKQSPIQAIISLQKMNVMSDQLYQIGLLYYLTYQLFDRFTVITLPIRVEVMGIKVHLFYLANCFFEHSKAQKQQPSGLISLPVVDNEITKQNQVKQCLVNEIAVNKLQFHFQLKPISPSIGEYSQKLLSFYQQSKQTLHYFNDKDYFLEYLQLLFILEKIEDLKLKASDVADLYNCIQDIQKSIQLEQNIKTYLRQKRGN